MQMWNTCDAVGMLVLLNGIRVGDFFSTLDAKYLNDLQEFLHRDLPHLVLIAVLAWVLIRGVRLLTNRMVRLAGARAADAARMSQVKTLASVIRATAAAAIVFLAILQVMPLLGFNLGPLLTSAGVAGVAIGLAAQTIVKDCLNGFLILIENQFNVGDIVRIAGQAGTVESLSLRKTMLRGFDGVLYVIPNSQITIAANVLRDFSVQTLTVSVDYAAEPDRVLALLKEVSLGVRRDPAYAAVFLEDPQILGVDGIKGSQVNYLLQLKTLANQQWGPLRELQRRLRVEMEKNGILPGDPLRVYTAPRKGDGSGRPEAALPVGHAAQALTVASGGTAADATAAKSTDVNPFTGEGL